MSKFHLKINKLILKFLQRITHFFSTKINYFLGNYGILYTAKVLMSIAFKPWLIEKVLY